MSAAWSKVQIPVGTRVRFWPGARVGEGRISRTRSRVWETNGSEPMVLVEDYPGGIYLSHVERAEDG